MPAVEFTHNPTPEDVMAYLDGEETARPREWMAAHLAECATCQAVAEDLRATATSAQAWHVDAPPASFLAPAPQPAAGVRRGSRSFYAAMGVFSAVAALLIVAVFQARPPLRSNAKAVAATEARREIGLSSVPEGAAGRRPLVVDRLAGQVAGGGGGAVAGVVRSPAPMPEAAPMQQAVPRQPMVIRTATLRLVVKEFDPARTAVERITAEIGGFVDSISVNGDPGAARTLTGTLRVPGTRLGEALNRLRRLGQVVEDAQGSEDVTDQVVDLQTRLANARATEARLTDLLKNRTGKLSDVLDVEREISRVRLEIERLDAERTNMGRRIAYATISITVSEERKAGIDGGPLTLATRIRVAAADGLENVVATLVGVMLFVLRSGPTLLLWGTVLTALWLAARRVHRGRSGSPA